MPVVTTKLVGLLPYLPVYNVKNYGAYGDGVHDDTAAIQAAWNAAAAGIGGAVFVQPSAGAYIISDELVPPNGNAVTFVGGGWGTPTDSTGFFSLPNSGSIIKQITTGKSIFHVNRQVSGFGVHDLAMVFSQSSTGHGIFLDPESFLSGTTPNFEQLTCCLGLSLRNLLVHGTDDAHYDYFLGNVIQGHLTALSGVGLGGFYKFFSYFPSGATATLNFGNCVLDGYWQHSAPAGDTYTPTVGVCSYEVNNNTTVGTPTLNYIQHRGVLDILLNANLSSNLVEGISTGTQSGIGNQLTIHCLQQNDLGVYTAPIENNISGLFVGFDAELIASGIEWTQQPNFRSEYSPIIAINAFSGSAPGTINSTTNQAISPALYRITVNLAVTTYTSGTVEAELSYVSSWDSLVHTISLCSLSAVGETTGTALVYASGGGQVVYAKIIGTFSANFHSWAVIERVAN
jgi:hypothetical protein